MDFLAAGQTVAEAQESFRQKYGETPDMEDFLSPLDEKGFVRVQGTEEPVAAAATVAGRAVAPANARVRYHFEDFPCAGRAAPQPPIRLGRSAPRSSPSPWRPPSATLRCGRTAITGPSPSTGR